MNEVFVAPPEGEEETRALRRGPILRGVYILAGLVFLALALIGAALPILPTTPFLLLAAFFFLRSSETLHRWLRGTSLYRNTLEGVARGHGMTRSAKTRVLTGVSALIGVSEFFMIRAWILKGSTGALIGALVLVIVWIAHIIGFAWWVPTKSPEDARGRSALHRGRARTDPNSVATPDGALHPPASSRIVEPLPLSRRME